MEFRHCDCQRFVKTMSFRRAAAKWVQVVRGPQAHFARRQPAEGNTCLRVIQYGERTCKRLHSARMKSAS